MSAGDLKLVYGTPADITITLASLPTSSTKLVGREGNALDNTTNLCVDYLVSGKITTGTSPTASKTIEIWAVGSWDGTLWPDVFDGTDSAETVSAQSVKDQICKCIASINTSNTNDFTYPFGTVSLRALFGEVPPKVTFFVTHDTGVNLNSTSGNHQIRVQPVYYNVAAA